MLLLILFPISYLDLNVSCYNDVNDYMIIWMIFHDRYGYETE